jgi:hypothetical protein
MVGNVGRVPPFGVSATPAKKIQTATRFAIANIVTGTGSINESYSDCPDVGFLIHISKPTPLFWRHVIRRTGGNAHIKL